MANSNGLIRLFIQTYLDFDLYAKVNVVTADWKTSDPAIQFSNILSLIVVILDIILPFLINCIHLKYTWRDWASEKFLKGYGSWLEGSTRMGEVPNVRDQTHLLIPASAFFARRFAFTTLMVLHETFVGQYIVSVLMIMAVLCMQLDRQRFDSKVASVVTAINEVTLAILSHLLVGFAMFVLEGAAQNGIGWVYLVFFLSNVAINAVVVLASSLRANYRWCRYKFW